MTTTLPIDGIFDAYVQGALWAPINQSLLSDYLETRVGGEHSWQVDVPNATVTFTGVDGRQVGAELELLASFAPGPRSMRWAWAMGRPGPESTRLRDWGQRAGLTWLTQAEVPLQIDADEPDELFSQLRQSSHVLAAAVEGISARAPYYTFPNGQGGVLLGLLRMPQWGGPRIDEAFPRRLSMGLEAVLIPDVRASVHRLGEHAGWGINWADAGHVQLTDPLSAGVADITFDEPGRVSDIHLDCPATSADKLQT